MSNYRGNFLFGFLSCGPYKYISRFAYDRLLCPSVEYDKNTGKAKVAPLGLRRIESALTNNYSERELLVVHPLYIERAISSDTKVVGLSEMDPRGIGPVTSSMSWTMTPFNRYWFGVLAARLRALKEEYDFKVVLGGPGAWQLTNKKYRQLYCIDHVVIGEADSAAMRIFSDIENGTADEVIYASTNSVDEVPLIRGPTTTGLIEAMRGCGRGCDFCAPNLRRKREFPLERLQEGSCNKCNIWFFNYLVTLRGYVALRVRQPRHDPQ